MSKIKNLIKWWPIVKDDQNYDYDYFLKVLEFKLRRLQSYLESHKTQTMSALRKSQEIKKVADAIHRYCDDDYCWWMYNALENEHGKIKDHWKPYDGKCDEFPDETDLIEFDGFYFTHSDNQAHALDLWSRINERARDLKQQDFEFVFDALKEQLQGWWD